MRVFTYSQYIKCIHTLRLNAILQLAEESEEYHLEGENKKYSHDKLIKNILKDEEEARKLINYFIRPKKEIEKGELVRYTNSYITKKYKSKEADLVYKLKEKEIFFLIEHQSTIDRTMPFRILNYCIDIIQEWSRNKKSSRYPIVVPIVVYTGDRNWKIPNNFREKQISSYVFEKYKIDLEYNLVDINKISKQILLVQNTMFAYILLIEKSQNKKELIENLSLIIKAVKNEEKLNYLTNIIEYLLENVLEEDVKKELLEEIDRKVGEKQMGTLYDRILAENRKILEQGEKQKEKEIIKKMINKKLEDKIIIEITGIKKEELAKIKNNLATVGK